MTSPIVVVGHPRSGTSLVCGLLNRAGVWFGPHEPEVTNPTGTFENEQLRRLPGNGHLYITLEDVLPILNAQGYTLGRWGVKIGRPDRAWRWRDLAPTFIKVRRKPEAILCSALARKALKGSPIGEEYPDLLRRRIDRTVEIMAEIPGFEIWPSELAYGRTHTFEALFKELDLKWTGEHFDAKLWHHF
jgi:hypothetical protein